MIFIRITRSGWQSILPDVRDRIYPGHLKDMTKDEVMAYHESSIKDERVRLFLDAQACEGDLLRAVR